MLGESLYRLYVLSNFFHSICKSFHSFIRCQIKDGDGHEIHCFVIVLIFFVIPIFPSFLNLSLFQFPLYTFFGFDCLLFPLYSTSSATLHIPPHVVPAISIGGQNLLHWCSSSFPFDVRDTCNVRFSFVESLPIRSSNIRNDVVRTKRGMEQETDPIWNLCWMSLKTLDEKFACDHCFFFFF